MSDVYVIRLMLLAQEIKKMRVAFEEMVKEAIS